MLEMRPLAEKVAQPAAPPAFETTRPVVEARPTLFTLKSVVVAEAVEEPIANRVVLVEPLFACTERRAKGEVVPMPIVPVPRTVLLPIPVP